jgi:hypothetical protein
MMSHRTGHKGLHDASDLPYQSQNGRNATSYSNENVTVPHFNQKAHCSTFEPCQPGAHKAGIDYIENILMGIPDQKES